MNRSTLSLCHIFVDISANEYEMIEKLSTTSAIIVQIMNKSLALWIPMAKSNFNFIYNIRS